MICSAISPVWSAINVPITPTKSKKYFVFRNLSLKGLEKWLIISIQVYKASPAIGKWIIIGWRSMRSVKLRVKSVEL